MPCRVPKSSNTCLSPLQQKRLRFWHCCRPWLSEAKSSLQSVRRRPQFPSKARNSFSLPVAESPTMRPTCCCPWLPLFPWEPSSWREGLVAFIASNSAAPTCATHDTQSTAVYRVNRIARVAGPMCSAHTQRSKMLCVHAGISSTRSAFRVDQRHLKTQPLECRLRPRTPGPPRLFVEIQTSRLSENRSKAV